MIPSLFAPAARLADPALLAGIRSDLPVLIASGDADPLAGGGALVQLLGQRYRNAGMTDVSVTLYRGARHEILMETDAILATFWQAFDDFVADGTAAPARAAANR